MKQKALLALKSLMWITVEQAYPLFLRESSLSQDCAVKKIMNCSGVLFVYLFKIPLK